MNASEIFLVDKPKGITSFDVIRLLRKKTGIRKMGHAGTLDPLATGLMIVGVNEGTKKMSEFLKLPKVYEAEVLLGKKTDTGDSTGRVIEEREAGEVSKEKIQMVVDGFVGAHELPVPMYSAIKVSGTPLYKLARKKENGKTLTEEEKRITPPMKIMEVLFVRLVEIIREADTIVVKMEMEVSSGSYIRALAEEFGERLGLPATLQNLRRTKIGEFSVADAMSLD